MRHCFFRRQLGSFIFTAGAGTLLHFLFDLSGKLPIIGAFSAVNESVWEHMKLLFVPMLTAALAQRLLLGRSDCYWSGKLTGMLTGLILIPALYYTYTGALGIHLTWLDISIFYIAAAAGYLAEAMFFRCKPHCSQRKERTAFTLLVLLAAAFVFFTFAPPALPIFRDNLTGGYGIIEK